MQLGLCAPGDSPTSQPTCLPAPPQGISNYNRAPADVKAADMEAATAKYDAELAAMGIDLLGLIKSGKKFIHNEVGEGTGVGSGVVLGARGGGGDGVEVVGGVEGRGHWLSRMG